MAGKVWNLPSLSSMLPFCLSLFILQTTAGLVFRTLSHHHITYSPWVSPQSTDLLRSPPPFVTTPTQDHIHPPIVPPRLSIAQSLKTQTLQGSLQMPPPLRSLPKTVELILTSTPLGFLWPLPPVPTVPHHTGPARPCVPRKQEPSRTLSSPKPPTV